MFWCKPMRQLETSRCFYCEKNVYIYTHTQEIEHGATYIIGGIVDRNRHKGLCAERASKLGIVTARLPLQKYVRLTSSAVLTTNHVAALLASRFETGSWRTAVEYVLPGRKIKEFLEDDRSRSRPTDQCHGKPNEPTPADDREAETQMP